ASEEEKVFSKKLELNCSKEKELYYTYDEPDIVCVVRNTGNFPFKQLKFCFKEQCVTEDLSISQEKSFSYSLKAPKAGINKVQFTIEGTDVSKSFFYDIEVMDEPKMGIVELEYPSQMEFQQPYEVAFTLNKSSNSIPINATLTFDAAGLKKTVEFAELRADKKYLFNLDSEDLSTKPNNFVISVSYYDQNAKLYTAKQEFDVELVNVTFSQRMVIWLHDADKWLRNLFK
ncbi:hypothetical protein HZB90_00795, partial [archaeon]|nr:hypothetical protein [archaeon]